MIGLELKAWSKMINTLRLKFHLVKPVHNFVGMIWNKHQNTAKEK